MVPRRFHWLLGGLAVVALGSATSSAQHFRPTNDAMAYWPPDQREAYIAYERDLMAMASPRRLREWHDMLASIPHVAGTPGDDEMVERMATAFEGMGLEVERHPIWVLLTDPVAAEVEIVSPDRLSLDLRERGLVEDPDAGDERLTFGFNAYSGSGEATGEVVYANHGRKEDFDRLRELGVDCTGKVVVARYGGNYRGYKAKYAQEAGAAALIIYTDPADSGYVGGLMYPEGGQPNETHIQRGSLSTIEYEGDPLTPFVEATEHAERLAVDEVALPRIPVQPMGYGAASEILSRMAGREVEDQSWQGGLAMRYRLEGGPGLRVRVRVEQPRSIKKTHNVIGVLRGSEFPDELVLIGAHHDAWGFGASDPTSGTICVFETARVFSELARAGRPPARSLAFCAWGAEEWGIIGSSEWVEANADRLSTNAVAYLNLDMASMGPNFGASSAPSLKRLIAEVSRSVPQAREPHKSVYDAWLARGADEIAPDEPRMGDLGGGSDHVAFWCYLSIPSAGLSAGGSRGTAYHSNYDTLAWYRKVVGEDYEPALMVARMAIGTASRLANAPLLPLDPSRYGPEFRKHLRAVSRMGVEQGVFTRLDEDLGVAIELAGLDAEARRAAQAWTLAQHESLGMTEAGSLGLSERVRFSGAARRADRSWIRADEPRPQIQGLEWSQSWLAAPDEESGYASWMLPPFRAFLKNPARVPEMSGFDSRPREYFYMPAGTARALETLCREYGDMLSRIERLAGQAIGR
ncbi:MAG: M28 family peptidase [Phycisphaeraceae bacterium]|nr:M28 family peptidase [Phycisphaeraceae bacterium]